jgi:aminotransferase
MLRIAHQFSRSATSFVQHAGVSALNETQQATQRMVRTYSQRRDKLTNKLSELKCSDLQPPEGTFFYFIDIRPYGKESQYISDYLLNKARVVTIPGMVYGPGGEGFIRLSFAYDDDMLEQGATAIVEALNNLLTS